MIRVCPCSKRPQKRSATRPRCNPSSWPSGSPGPLFTRRPNFFLPGCCLQGMMNNCVYRVKIHPEALPGELGASQLLIKAVVLPACLSLLPAVEFSAGCLAAHVGCAHSAPFYGFVPYQPCSCTYARTGGGFGLRFEHPTIAGPTVGGWMNRGDGGAKAQAVQVRSCREASRRSGSLSSSMLSWLVLVRKKPGHSRTVVCIEQFTWRCCLSCMERSYLTSPPPPLPAPSPQAGCPGGAQGQRQADQHGGGGEARQ